MQGFFVGGRFILTKILARFASGSFAKQAIKWGGMGFAVKEMMDIGRQLWPDAPEGMLEQYIDLAAEILEDDEVLWPTHMRGAKQGEPIEPVYLTFNIPKGIAWLAGTYRSAKSVSRGYFKGIRSGRRQARKELSEHGNIANIGSG